VGAAERSGGGERASGGEAAAYDRRGPRVRRRRTYVRRGATGERSKYGAAGITKEQRVPYGKTGFEDNIGGTTISADERWIGVTRLGSSGACSSNARGEEAATLGEASEWRGGDLGRSE
jgi:hypothetical protein